MELQFAIIFTYMSGEHYRHPDLRVRLNSPNEARIFLDDPMTWLPYKKPKAIPLHNGSMIPLNTQKMTDEEVVFAAFLKLWELVEQAQLEWPIGLLGEQ